MNFFFSISLFFPFDYRRLALNSVRFFTTKDGVSSTSSPKTLNMSISKKVIKYFASVPNIFDRVQLSEPVAARSVILIYPPLKCEDLGFLFKSKIQKSYEKYGIESFFLYSSKDELLVYLTFSKKLTVQKLHIFNIDLLFPLAIYTVISPVQGRNRFLKCLRRNSSLVDPKGILCSFNFVELLESHAIIAKDSFRTPESQIRIPTGFCLVQKEFDFERDSHEFGYPYKFSLEPVNFDITYEKNWITCHCPLILSDEEENADIIRWMLGHTIPSILDEGLSYKVVVHLTGFNKNSQIIFIQSSIVKGVYDKKSFCESKKFYLDLVSKLWSTICDYKLSRWSFGLRVEECNQFFKDK